MKYNRRSYQHDILRFGCKHARCNIFGGMGIGKTPATFDIIDSCFNFGWAKRVLILAPSNPANSVWPTEHQKFDDFKHLTLAVATGNPKQRIAALAQNTQIVVCTYELLPWLVAHMGDAWDFDMVVADEVTRIRNLRVSMQPGKLRKDGTRGKPFLTGQGGKRAKSLGKLAFTKVKRWIGLTGTPAPNGLQDLWAIMFFVDTGERLFRSHSAFLKRWFYRETSYGDYLGKLKPFKHSQRQIQRMCRQVCLTIEAKDYFDIKEPIVNIKLVTLPPKAMQHYKEMEKKLFTEVQGVINTGKGDDLEGIAYGIEAINAGSKSQKLLQIASGALYTDADANWVAIHDAKLDALDSIIEEAMGMPILLAYQYKSDWARIKERFPHAIKVGKDPKIIDDFNAGLIPLLAGHPKGMGHGLNLQYGTNIMVHYSTGWNLEDDQQFNERAGPTRQMQAGFKREVYIHRIVAKGTLEEEVVERIKSKASVQQTFMNAMKRLAT